MKFENFFRFSLAVFLLSSCFVNSSEAKVKKIRKASQISQLRKNAVRHKKGVTRKRGGIIAILNQTRASDATLGVSHNPSSVESDVSLSSEDNSSTEEELFPSAPARPSIGFRANGYIIASLFAYSSTSQLLRVDNITYAEATLDDYTRTFTGKAGRQVRFDFQDLPLKFCPLSRNATSCTVFYNVFACGTVGNIASVCGGRGGSIPLFRERDFNQLGFGVDTDIHGGVLP